MSNEFHDLLRTTMEALTRDLAQDGAPIEQTLAEVTAAAVGLLPAVDAADVLLIDNGVFTSVASTSPVGPRLDGAQRDTGEGPCLDAARATAVVRCDDLSTDPRWPSFTAIAVDTGVHSMLSYQLYTHGAGSGALNLFSEKVGAFSHEAEAVGAMLATHAALALIAVNRQRQFESALASRDLIGQAKGMIMERFNVDAVRAFDLLRLLSQNQNIPLRDVASQIVASGPERRDPG
ncbi:MULTISPECIES: GAF and ANTAR domain-containing protein [Mycobacterium]|nr:MULTISPECIES: GAF and ANTAR domain-containing protein [Mycobacterium]